MEGSDSEKLGNTNGKGGGIGIAGNVKLGILIDIPGMAGSDGNLMLMLGIGSGGGMGIAGSLKNGILQLLMGQPPS